MDWLACIFPQKCVGCGQLGAYICSDCLNLLQPMTNLYCPVCRRPSLNGHTHPRCAKTQEIDGLISAYVYKGIIKRIIAKYKYKFIFDLNHIITELLISELKSPILFKQSWILVPVPLHHSRRRWRGFNQAELLAHSLNHEWNFPVEDNLLIRVRPTRSQMTLTGSVRKNNLKNAFAVAKNRPVSPSILLIDDVATSCSTLRECAATLKAAGAKTVWGLTLAQAIPS